MAPSEDRRSPGRGATKPVAAPKAQRGATAGTMASAGSGPIVNLLVLGTAKLAARQLAKKIGYQLDKRYRLTESPRPARASRQKARVYRAGGEVCEAHAEVSLDRFAEPIDFPSAKAARRVAVVDLTPVAPPTRGASAAAHAALAELLAGILDHIRELRHDDPSVAVLALVDSSDQRVIGQALSAGADEILLSDDVKSRAQVSARVQAAIARAATRTDPAGSAEPATVAPANARTRGTAKPAVRESPSAAPSEEELTAALARVDGLAGKRLTVEERAEQAASASNDVLAIVARSLRSESGRLDAKRIAKRLGVSVAALAQAIGKQRQTVNKTPDADDLQRALAPMARIVSLLEDALAPKELSAWLSSSHAGLGGATPRAEILAGRASRVALMLESALGGGA